MGKNRDIVIKMLEDYKFNQLLYKNMKLEIDRLKKELKISPRMTGEVFKIKLELESKIIKRRSEEENAIRYNDNVDSAIGVGYKNYNPMELLMTRIEQREIVKKRIKTIENALAVLSNFQLELVKQGIIYRKDGESIDEISERLRVEPNIYYAERDKALNKLERVLIGINDIA